MSQLGVFGSFPVTILLEPHIAVCGDIHKCQQLLQQTHATRGLRKARLIKKPVLLLCLAAEYRILSQK